MTVPGNLSKIYQIAGNCRSLLLSRAIPTHQPNAGAKQTIEEKLGFPAKPKRPLTPYFKFMAKIRPNLKQKNPEAKLTDIAKLGAQHWEKADPVIREQFGNTFKQEMAEYIQDLKKYEKNLTVDQREEIQKAIDEAEELKERKRLRKKMKEMGKPKKPAAAFLVYAHENQSLRSDMKFKDFIQKIAKEWRNLPENVKSKYIVKHKQALEYYKHDLQVWEEKMIRLGHIDIVRNEALIEPSSRIPRGGKKSQQGE